MSPRAVVVSGHCRFGQWLLVATVASGSGG